MKVVQINTFPYKATGNIMMNIHQLLIKQGYESYVCWGRGRKAENSHEIVISDNLGVKLHGIYSRLFDRSGFASVAATKKLLKRLDEIEPDIIHIHNLHGYYINIPMLFAYIKRHKIKLVWTLHDCWAFTGHCAWFDMCGCEKWKTGCGHCEQLNTYPASKLLDNSSGNWKKKKELFTGLEATIVTPSYWLASLIKKSFLKDYPVKVIYNGIDLEMFRPTYNDAVRGKYGLDERPIILGVASEWTPRKGLNDFIELSKQMHDTQFVVVGLTDKQLKETPSTIKGLLRTSSQAELVALYSLADVFFNPTYEDNFPTTNLESLACGTPVVTYDTGGSPESIDIAFIKAGKSVGEVINKMTSSEADLTKVEEIIRRVLVDSKHNLIRTNCRQAACFFDKNECFLSYINIYREMLR